MRATCLASVKTRFPLRRLGKKYANDPPGILGENTAACDGRFTVWNHISAPVFLSKRGDEKMFGKEIEGAFFT